MSDGWVSLVDDDESVLESLPALLLELGYQVQVWASAEEFLGSGRMVETKCLILDVFLRGMSGPELIRELADRRVMIPTIYVTAHTEETLKARLLAEGAVACLFKPFSETALLAALGAAFRVGRPN